MSGPALRQRDAHHAIHESAYSEAEELTLLLEQLIEEAEFAKATAMIPVIIEHWETRTLSHAREEETGLYLEIRERRPELAIAIARLERDHEILRRIVVDITVSLGELPAAVDSTVQNKALRGILQKCQMLLWMNRLHSRAEETTLL